MSRIAVSVAMAAVVSSCFSTLFGQEAAAPQSAPVLAPGSVPAVTDPSRLELTLEGALGLARRSSPAALVGPLRVREADSGRADAAIYPRDNPLLEVELGPRLIDDDPQSVAFRVGLTQTLDLGGGVGARMRRVDAEVGAATAGADASMQQALRSVALAFLRGVWARERAGLAAQTEGITKSVLVATQKRVDAGDATALELNIAKGAHARAVADRKGVEATQEAAHGELRALLGVPPTTAFFLEGRLDDARAIDLVALKKGASRRADVRAIAADVESAEADQDLASALAAPQLGLGARYELEDKTQHTILGVLTMTLPIFDHAQALTAQADAKAARAKAELSAKKTQAAIEIDTAATVAARRQEAATAFEAEKGVESFQDNLRLAIRGYDAGELSLGDVLLVRRELVDTEAARIDRLLELRNAEIELLYAAGAIR